ncbi:MAG: methyltransferase domain-containing protein [Proteobacteria bacterium]|nr:methyltransferase domain-containing protein [Pseudomonadota bacterium]
MDTSTSSIPPARAGEYQQRGDYHREPDPSWRYYPVYVEKLARVRAYLDRVPAAQARILDVGCGEGLLVEEYRKQGRDIQGLDLHYSSPFVTRGDITQLPWEPGSFDLVLALDVIEHLGYATQAQAFSELARVLKPGGRALVSLPNLAHFASRLAFLFAGRLLRTSQAERHPGDRPIAEYLELIKDSGFEVLSRRGVFPTFPLISALTWFAPARSLPLHRLLNATLAWPGFCFLNLLELRKRA